MIGVYTHDERELKRYVVGSSGNRPEREKHDRKTMKYMRVQNRRLVGAEGEYIPAACSGCSFVPC